MPDAVLYATIYPSRVRRSKAFAAYAASLALIIEVDIVVVSSAWPFTWHRLTAYGSAPGLGVLILSIFPIGPFCLVSASSLLYRLISWFPSIQVTSQGIIDNCSLLAGGVGLIPWSAITDIFPTSLSPTPDYNGKDRYLLVRVNDPNALQPNTAFLRLLRRVLPLANHARRDIIISSYMTSMHPGDLIAPIRAACLAERRRNPALHRMYAIAGIA